MTTASNYLRYFHYNIVSNTLSLYKKLFLFGKFQFLFCSFWGNKGAFNYHILHTPFPLVYTCLILVTPPPPVNVPSFTSTLLPLARYLCFDKHRRRNLNTSLNIYSRESIFLSKEKNDDSEKIKGFRKNGGVDYIPCKGCTFNKSNSYTHTAWNANVISTRYDYEKTVTKRKKKGFQKRI